MSTYPFFNSYYTKEAIEPMAHEALYTRTRPKCLAHLVGQDHISTPLTAAINKDRIAHAYLLVGTRGTGKTSTARLMARAVNCDEVFRAREQGRPLSAKEIPCGKCAACQSFQSSPDNIEFDAASNRSVEDISRLLSTVYLAPMQSRVKTFIIDEVHMLSFEAVNSILKLIEEPPDNVVFFLATTEYNKVPLTIRSRCQVLNFKLIAQERIADYIVRVGKLLNLEIESDAARKLARLARGSMRDALTLVDQCHSMIEDPRLTLQIVDDTLGLVADSDLDELIAAVRDKNKFGVSAIVAKVFGSGITAVNFGEELVTRLRDRVVKLDKSRADEFYECERMIDLLRAAIVEMRASGIPDIILETTLLKLASDVGEPVRVLSEPSAQKKTPVEQPRESDAEEMNAMKSELGGDVQADEQSQRLLRVLVNYFDKNHKANIASMLRRVSSFVLDGDRLTVTFGSVFEFSAFEQSGKAEVERLVSGIFEKPIAVENVCYEKKPRRSKQNINDAIATSRGEKRAVLVNFAEHFGKNVVVHDTN